MTVLQRNAATGVDVGQLGRTLGMALVIGAMVVGVVFAVNSSSQPQGLSPAQIEQVRADALVERFQSQFYAEANALNVADIGRPSTGAVVTADDGDKADLIIKQKGAELADPADRIHKQKAAELGK